MTDLTMEPDLARNWLNVKNCLLALIEVKEEERAKWISSIEDRGLRQQIRKLELAPVAELLDLPLAQWSQH